VRRHAPDRKNGARLAFLCLFVALLGAGSALPAGARATVSSGAYVDAAGVSHSWTINAAHTLVWADKPFVPVGGLFQAKSWAPGATEADWESDRAAITALKSHNVTDIYVQPARGGLTAVSPAAIQRLLDLLDAQGFTYGLSINDGPHDALSGYVVRPGAYWRTVPEEGGTLRFPMDGIRSALYFIVTTGLTDFVQTGDAKMTAEGASVVAKPLPGDYTAFLVPQKIYFAGGPGGIGLPNLWDGFDAYRDSLLALFRRVRLGSGFRFFVDALPPNLTVTGPETEHLIPTGQGFATEWSAYLGRHYRSIDALAQAWGITDYDLRDIEHAARLIPLWGGGKGMEDFYDPATKTETRADTHRSVFWNDLNQFKAQSVRRCMNDLATVLKRAVADVPVVYRSAGYSPLFASLPPDRGFDGIGIDAYGRGADLVTHSAGYVYAQAADAPRTMWLPVTSTADAAPAQKTAPGYASPLALQSDFDYLREIGARGFYVSGVRLTDPKQQASDLSTVPDQLGWLADYQRLLEATGIRAAQTVPSAVFYPRGVRSASLRAIARNSWWLPTDRPYVSYDFGPVGRAYAFTENGNTVYYLYRPDGPIKISLKIPKASRIAGAPPISWSAAANGEIHKDVLTLTIGPDPVRILNLNSLPVPREAFPVLISEASTMLKAMRARNILEAGRYDAELSGARIRFSDEQPYSGVQDVERILNEMRSYLSPYAWIEAESARVQTFDEIAARAGASGGQVLLVDPRSSDSPDAIATYGNVNVKDAGLYEVWVAASPDAPLTFRLDGQAMLDEAVLPKKVGAPYADGSLVWMRYGTTTLPVGQHVLEVRANGPAAVDVILLIKPGQFVPDGANRPMVNP
jgi:hypothetical protein